MKEREDTEASGLGAEFEPLGHPLAVDQEIHVA